MKPEIVLGIDPGYDRLGWGVIQKQGSGWQVLDFGCAQTSAKQEMPERLQIITAELQKVIQKFQPIAAGVEDLFFFKNAKTAIKVGQARGAILLTLKQADLKVLEFTPLQIKQQVAGNGRAEKCQVQKMISLILGMKEKKLQDDAADALAVAYCAGQALVFESKLKK